jgi:outer membrane protein assembly factor BamA
MQNTILCFSHFIWFTSSLSGGHVVGNFSPYEAFAIGGTNSVRGYEEGGVGSGRSYVVGSGEISFPMVLEFYQVFSCSISLAFCVSLLILIFKTCTQE